MSSLRVGKSNLERQVMSLESELENERARVKTEESRHQLEKERELERRRAMEEELAASRQLGAEVEVLTCSYYPSNSPHVFAEEQAGDQELPKAPGAGEYDEYSSSSLLPPPPPPPPPPPSSLLLFVSAPAHLRAGGAAAGRSQQIQDGSDEQCPAGEPAGQGQ
eukprot:391794-Hanusia_phi.AAC.2